MTVNNKNKFQELEKQIISDEYLLQMLEWHILENPDTALKYVQQRLSREINQSQTIDLNIKTNKKGTKENPPEEFEQLRQERDLLALLCARLAIASKIYAGVEFRGDTHTELFIDLPKAGALQFPIRNEEMVEIKRDWPNSPNSTWLEFPGHKYDGADATERIERIKKFLATYYKAFSEF